MEYTYNFATENYTIEVDERTYAMLKEADRLERNNTQTYRRWIHSLESYGFEPEFMAVEDDAFKDEAPASPAYQYAIRRIRPKHQDILIRRLVYGETFPQIAQFYNISGEAVRNTYFVAKKHFLRFYRDGRWIYSKENTSRPEAERIRYIPFGLTPSQVQQIRTLRYEHNTLDAIAKQVGVPQNRVKVCLRHNPITELKCLNCGAAIKQIYAGKLQNFCCKPCYYQWFHKEGMVHNTCPTIKKKRSYMSRQQQIATDFYRQLLIPQKDIAKIKAKAGERK